MQEPFFIEKLITEALKNAKDEFKGTEEKFEKIIEIKVPEMISSVTRIVMDEVFRDCTSNSSGNKRAQRKVKRQIDKVHGFALSLFSAFIELNSQISAMTYHKWYQQFNEYDDLVKLDTLVANHVRGCQIANEVRVLVANGYADGAHARWRTLHEVCVVFIFLYDHETIHMYNDYEIIEKWKKAKEYRDTYEQLDFEPLEESEWLALQEDHKTLIAKYGPDYGDNYGWMIRHMPKGRRNFKELERLSGQEHFRAVYGWANENVHAGVSGIRDRLGFRENEQHHFLVGPSANGFLDPVQYTAASLAEMSHVLLGMEDSVLNTIFSELLTFMQSELVKAFDETQTN